MLHRDIGLYHFFHWPLASFTIPHLNHLCVFYPKVEWSFLPVMWTHAWWNNGLLRAICSNKPHHWNNHQSRIMTYIYIFFRSVNLTYSIYKYSISWSPETIWLHIAVIKIHPTATEAQKWVPNVSCHSVTSI